MRDYISLTAAVIVFVARSVLSCRQVHHYLVGREELDYAYADW